MMHEFMMIYLMGFWVLIVNSLVWQTITISSTYMYLIKTHVQTSTDSDYNMCVRVFLYACIMCMFIVVNANACHTCHYGAYWCIVYIYTRWICTVLLQISLVCMFCFMYIPFVCTWRYTSSTPLHTEHPPVWGLASTTMAFLEIGGIGWREMVNVPVPPRNCCPSQWEIPVAYFGLLSYCTDILPVYIYIYDICDIWLYLYPDRQK